MDQRAGAIVRNAARAIEKYGWIQGIDGDEDSGMCIRGAINHIEREQFYDLQDPDERYWDSETDFSLWMGSLGLYEEIRRDNVLAKVFDDWGLVPLWNDQLGRTKEEVLLHMNKFADEMDPQGP